MTPNWIAVAETCEAEKSRANSSLADRVQAMKRHGARMDREAREHDEFLARKLVFERIARICRKMATEVITERIARILLECDLTHSDILDRDTFPVHWADAYAYAIEQCGIRQDVSAQNENTNKNQPAMEPPKPQSTVPVVEHPNAAAKKKERRAEHEAAHGVVRDELVGKTEWINIGGDGTKQWMLKIVPSPFEQQLSQTDWDDPAQMEAAKPKVLDLVTVYVAGHLAENVIDSTEPRISGRMTPELLEAGQDGNADLDKVAWLLKLVKCNTMEEVLAAEQRAKEILERRKNHLRALSDELFKEGYIEGAKLNTALGK